MQCHGLNCNPTFTRAAGPALARLRPHVVVWFDPCVSPGVGGRDAVGKIGRRFVSAVTLARMRDLSAAIKLARLRKFYSRFAL
jgi:hypothetical protein